MNSKERKEKLLELLQPGDVLNSDSKPRWWEFWMRVLYAEIRRYQKRKWKGRSPRKRGWRDVHSMLYLGDGRFLSVTVPRSVICELEVSERAKYRICRYQSEDWNFREEELAVLKDAAQLLVGHGYDYGQLLDILLKQLFPSFVKEKLSLFDFGRKRKVCSVGVHFCFLAWWYKFAKEIYPRPLGKQYLEITCPADFANHETFKVIAEDI
ncbi:MAG: hypothetical protein V1784_04295 [bacterium]